MGLLSRFLPSRMPMANRMEQKVSMAGWITSFMRIGQPVWTKRDYAGFSREGYMKNSVVFRSVKLCASGAAKVPFIVRDRNTKKEIEDKENPLYKILHRPNPWQSGAAFWEGVYAFRKIAGQAYIEGVVGDAEPAPMGIGRPPDQLFNKRPDYIKIVASKFGTPAGYVYESNSQKQVWEADPFDGSGAIIHWKTFNPLDEWYGLSDLEAAAYAIDTHNEASAWGKALLQNSGAPSGVLQREATNDAPTTLTERQFEIIKERLKTEYQGAKNAGMPWLLDGGFKWTAMGLSPKELDWIEGKHVNAREICHALGVPPYLLGIPGDSTYNNYREARQGLYEDTILPEIDSLCDELNMKLAPLFNENWEIAYDEDEIPALAPKRAERWTMVQNANWLTTDEKREATCYEPLGTPEAEEVLIPSTVTPLTGILDAPTDPNVDPVTGKPMLPDPNAPDPEEDPAKPGEKKPPVAGKKPPIPVSKSQAERMERKAIERLLGIFK